MRSSCIVDPPAQYYIVLSTLIPIMADYDDFPETYTDGFGRIYCKDHKRDECHICQMSFRQFNEEIDENPSDRNIGIFISEESLVEWHSKMQELCPRVFTSDDKIFGKDYGQHPYGTKLLAFFGDDPNKPMKCQVAGSRWSEERPFPGGKSYYADDREPFYVILINGELSQIELTSAHEEAGWQVVSRGGAINERLDSLARINSVKYANCGGELYDGYYFSYMSDSDDDNDNISDDDEHLADLESRYPHNNDVPLQVQNYYIRQALKKLTKPYMQPWNDSMHGHFLIRFFKYNFTPEEREHILRSKGGVENTASNNDDNFANVITEQLKEFSLEESIFLGNSNFCARLLLAQIAARHMSNLGGVIIVNERGTKFQAIEFNNNYANENHHVPCVNIRYGTDPEGIDNPKSFLCGESYEVIQVKNELAVVLENIFLNCVKNEGLNDVGSGLLYHDGYIAPAEIIPLKEADFMDVSSNAGEIPNINFGVELELSCASGNYRQRTAAKLATHAGIDVRQAFFGENGKGEESSKRYVADHKGCTKMDVKKASKNDKWKLVLDQSIEANKGNPLSAKFELVSPILSGQDGIKTLSRTVVVMTDVACVRVNKSMGLHVHVEAKEDDYTLSSMISICQQFLLHEKVIDSFLPNHRRSNSSESRRYFRSNITSILSKNDSANSSVDVLNILCSCQSRDKLYDLMNPNAGKGRRYHKLNLQNLKTGRQPTIEFRQHHASKDEKDITSWVRFCVLFVCNSAKLQPVTATKEMPDATFDTLFDTIIQCSLLKNYYSQKKLKYEKKV